MEKCTSSERRKFFQAGERKIISMGNVQNFSVISGGFFQDQESKSPGKSWNSITIFCSVASLGLNSLKSFLYTLYPPPIMNYVTFASNLINLPSEPLCDFYNL
jgi:hypothetical protein